MNLKVIRFLPSESHVRIVEDASRLWHVQDPLDSTIVYATGNLRSIMAYLHRCSCTFAKYNLFDKADKIKKEISYTRERVQRTARVHEKLKAVFEKNKQEFSNR